MKTNKNLDWDNGNGQLGHLYKHWFEGSVSSQGDTVTILGWTINTSSTTNLAGCPSMIVCNVSGNHGSSLAGAVWVQQNHSPGTGNVYVLNPASMNSVSLFASDVTLTERVDKLF